MTNNDSFGPWLRQAIADAKLSQSELARRIGVSVTSVNRWVHNIRIPRASRYEPLARELGLPRDVVMKAAGVLDEKCTRVGPRAHLLELLEWMPDHEIEMILIFVKFRAEQVRISMRDRSSDKNSESCME